MTVHHRGRVLRFLVAPGDRVGAGDPVAELVLPEVAEAAARLDALARRRALVRSRLRQLESLEKEGLTRAEALFDLRSQAAALREEQRVAEAVLGGYRIGEPDRGRSSGSEPTIRDGRFLLRAPEAGVVVARPGRTGEVLEPGADPLLVLAAPRPVRIEASLVGPLPAGATARFVTQDGRKVPLGPQPMASYRDGTTGRVTVWWAPDPPVELPDRLPGHVRLALPSGAVEVPSGALRDRAVAVLRDGEVAWVEVEVLLDSGTSAVVRGDLDPGEEVAQDAGELPR